MRVLTCFALSTVLLSGCETLPHEPSASGLGQTNWTLIDVRSPPTAEPVDVPLNKYQMSFKGDGQATFTLDCNKGSGSWKAVPNAPGKGTITFGPIASTMMACPESGAGDRMGGDLTGSWPYEIYDGRLTITTTNAAYTFDSIA